MKFAIILIALLILAAAVPAQSSYAREVAKWRVDHAAELTNDDGWLTVAGLYWLKSGVNTIGSGGSYDIELTSNFKQGKFGTIDFRDGVATLRVEPRVAATNLGKAVAEIQLVSDEDQKQTIIEVGSQTFYLIKREDKLGVRIKDKASEARKSFDGLKWFPIVRSFRVVATFEPFPEKKEVLIPNVLGGTFKMKSPGTLRFRIGGKVFTIQPVEEGERLFIIFRDLTYRTETYGAGRFLYADKPVNGKVVLDFNKAENPPCAFTQFATCPLPPKQNRLDIAIRAGEKRYRH